ncbi:MAG: hypothetical protein WCI04_05150, partial [archaeon]
MDMRDSIRAKLLKKAKDQINQKLAGREIHIIKAVNLLSDLDSITNLLRENASEWKMRKPVGDAQTEFTILEKNADVMDTEKKSLTEFIEKEMYAEFPNFSVLATPILGAKLLASAGSKKRLAFMPASTIQVLGAEKALFAHLRRNAKSPKHGHLFNHPLMQKLPRFKRGRVARIIAGKLAIALKQDYFEGEDTSKTAIKELDEQIMKIASEPITAKQELKEKMLEKQHEEGYNETTTEKSQEKGRKPASKTFTPEERREFFKKQNEGKTENIASKPIEGTTPSEEITTPHEEKPFREKSFAPRREESFGDRRSYAPRRNSNYAPREGSYGERKSYAPREGSYAPRREEGLRPRRESSFGERKSYGSREGSSYPRRSSYDSPRRTFSHGSEGRTSYGPKTSNYGPRPEGSYGGYRSGGARDRNSTGEGSRYPPKRNSFSAPRSAGSYGERKS